MLEVNLEFVIVNSNRLCTGVEQVVLVTSTARVVLCSLVLFPFRSLVFVQLQNVASLQVHWLGKGLGKASKRLFIIEGFFFSWE